MTATRIVRPPEAFRTSATRRKNPRKQDKGYLAWLHDLPCIVTGQRPVDAAHVRLAAPEYGKRETGKAEKPSDKWALPLHRTMHDEQHAGNEREFWQRKGLDPISLCMALHDAYEDDNHEAALLIVSAAVLRASQRP